MIAFVNVGADEVNCPDVYNQRDWNADGLVNLVEFNAFSRAWLSIDPNAPSPPTDPNVSAHWDPRCDLNSDYNVNLADLIIFIDDTPWLWTACWRTDLQQMQQMASMGGCGEQMMMPATPSTSLEPLQSAETATPAIVEPAEITPVTESTEPIEIDPVVERENLLSLLDDIDGFIDAGGDDAQAWQEMKILLEQVLADTEDTTNDPNEV